MELDIAALAKVTGDKSTAEHFLKASQDRVTAIKSIFWNSNKGQWLDYWLSDSTCQVVSLCKSLWCLTVNSPSAVLLIVRFDSFRNLKLGKLVTRIRMYMLQILFLCGSSHSTQVCDSYCSPGLQLQMGQIV